MIGKTNAQRKILLTTPNAVTPTKSQQIITTPEDYDGLESVTVNAIPDNYIDTSAGDATAAQILSGKKAYVDGSLITGTMTNRGNVGVKTLNATTTSYTIPAGYHNGSGKVQHSTATQATPTISVNSSGLITASSTQSAGYVSSGTKNATYTLSEDDDSNFKASNIKEGVSIFGVLGSMPEGLTSKVRTATAYADWGMASSITFSDLEQEPSCVIVVPSEFVNHSLGCFVYSCFNMVFTYYTLHHTSMSASCTYSSDINYCEFNENQQTLTINLPIALFDPYTTYFCIAFY